ncbi:hypothetical protein DSECCO2_529810 [anaerobic digester metagenome]
MGAFRLETLRGLSGYPVGAGAGDPLKVYRLMIRCGLPQHAVVTVLLRSSDDRLQRVEVPGAYGGDAGRVEDEKGRVVS